MAVIGAAGRVRDRCALVLEAMPRITGQCRDAGESVRHAHEQQSEEVVDDVVDRRGRLSNLPESLRLLLDEVLG